MREAGITLGIIGWVIGLLIGIYLAAVGILIANEVGDRDTVETYTMLFNLEKDGEAVIFGKGKLIATGVITLITAIVGIVGASMGKSQNLASFIMMIITSVVGLLLFVLAISFWSGSVSGIFDLSPGHSNGGGRNRPGVRGRYGREAKVRLTPASIP